MPTPTTMNSHIFLPPTQSSQHSDNTVSIKDSKFSFDGSDPQSLVESVAIQTTTFDIFNFDYTDELSQEDSSLGFSRLGLICGSTAALGRYLGYLDLIAFILKLLLYST